MLTRHSAVRIQPGGVDPARPGKEKASRRPEESSRGGFRGPEIRCARRSARAGTDGQVGDGPDVASAAAGLGAIGAAGL